MIKKRVFLAALVSTIVLSGSTVFAEGVSNNLTDLATPTLTELHSKTPSESPIQSSYGLDNNSSGNYIIRKYLIQQTSGVKTTTQKDYSLNFNTLGNPSGTNSNYYKWQTIDGNKSLTTATLSDADLIVKTTGSDNVNISSPALYNGTLFGGAISVTSYTNIGDTSANFIDNNFSNAGGNAFGGAFMVDYMGASGSVTGDFIHNYISSTSGHAYGGGFYNGGIMGGNITGHFIGNYVTATSNAQGGAIYNAGSIYGDIIGDFINNHVSSTSSFEGMGGAIYNTGNVDGDIIGDFINNYVLSSSAGMGGAIFHSGSIDNLTGDFINNYVSTTADGKGGAILNWGSITNLTGDFVNNYVSTSANGTGGAISNAGDITNLTGDFINNYVSAVSSAEGGAIFNAGTITDLTGDFINNHVSATSFEGRGGAIFNYTGTITNLTGDFINNHSSAVSFDAMGGAISNWGTITNLKGDFINNYAVAVGGNAQGGAIYNHTGTITNLTGDFIDNHAVSNGGEAQGGAIYIGKGNVNLVAKDKNIQFSGNYVSNDGGVTKQSNAIYFFGTWLNNPNLNLNADTDKSIVFNDSISSDASTDSYKVININATQAQAPVLDGNAPTTGTIVLNNDMSGYKGDVNLYGGTIKVGTGKYTYTDSQGVLRQNVATNPTLFSSANSFNVYGGMIDFLGSPLKNYSMGNVVLNSDLAMKVNADLANSKMQKISAISLTNAGNHHINVSQITLLSDAKSNSTSINFANTNLKNAVQYTGEQGISYSPLYKYDVAYDSTNGNFNFTRSGGGSSSYESYNPTVYSAGTAAQTGGYLGALATYNEVLNRVDQPMLDNVMLQTQLGYDPKFLNKIAAVGGQPEFSPLMDKTKEPAVWFRPFSTFENVPLNNGPKVDSTSYGGIFGIDSKLKELRHGYQGVATLYGGYTGSHQKYDGVSIYQNGGYGGVMGTLYKGNFFSALTANVGASNISTNNSPDFGMLNTGASSRTGYNWKLLNNKLILQPNYMMSYTLVKTQDYTNYQGVNISTDNLNAIQIIPGIKVIGNLKNGWQPYSSVSMVFNLLDDAKVTANNVSLPEVSVDPYVEYGVGVQKKWGQRFTGFFQAMVRNGGRNGVSLLAGFKWAI